MSPSAVAHPAAFGASANSSKIEASISIEAINRGVKYETQPDDNISIETLRAQYERDSRTPVDVVRTVYERIAAYHDKAVWITLMSQEDALARARDLSQRYPDREKRPALFGIPFSVKDSIDVAGMPTTLACPSYAYTAAATAPAVQRILDAGGILIGKTNLDQFATGLNGTRSPYGIPRCVHDPEYISGGSSSGSVVSVAAHLVSFTVATDTAGSTRVPAALNGVVGLKPTLGTISTVGLVPACKTADCITIIAPTVDSALAALDVMQAYDENDVYARDPQELAVLAQQPAWAAATARASTTSLDIRYALPPPHLLDEALCPEYARLWDRFVAALAAAPETTQVTAGDFDFDYEPFASANAMLYGSSIVAQRVVAFKDYLDRHGHDQLHPVIREIFQASAGFDAVRAYQDIFDLARYRRLAARQFHSSSSSLPSSSASSSHQGIDVLIVPSTTTHPTVAEMLADPIDLNKRLGSFTHFVNLLDLCAVSIPLDANASYSWKSRNGRDMPFAVTLISLPGRDLGLLRLGSRLRDLCV